MRCWGAETVRIQQDASASSNNDKSTSSLAEEQQSLVLPLSWTARVQNEHLFHRPGSFLFYFPVVSSFLAAVAAEDLQFNTHCLSQCLHTHLLPRSLNHKSAVEHRWHCFLPSGTIWLQRIPLILFLILPPARPSHQLLRASSLVISPASQTSSDSQCAHSFIFPFFSLIPLSLSLSLPYFLPPHFPLQAHPSVFLHLPRSFSLLHPRLSVRCWQLRSSGALRGAEKTKIWFSGSDHDFLQIGWKIRRSFYSYTTQSAPTLTPPPPSTAKAWLQTTGVAAISTNVPSVTRRLCVFYLKPRRAGELSVLSTGPRRSWCGMQDGKESETSAQCT